MSDLIKKVWMNKSNNQKCVTIPKDSDIKQGDNVLIKKIEVEEDAKAKEE